MSQRRQKRARAHIPIRELLASALSDLLPEPEARALREQQVPAERIICMFTPDHVDLFALGGTDDWHNIRMRRRGPELKAKDARDTSIVAKHDRVTQARREHLERMARKLIGPSPFVDMPKRSQWPQGRKLQSRGFQRRP
jgi:hypothetical protein